MEITSFIIKRKKLSLIFLNLIMKLTNKRKIREILLIHKS